MRVKSLLVCMCMVGLLFLSDSANSEQKAIPVSIGDWMSITPDSLNTVWQVYCWKDNPILIDCKDKITLYSTGSNIISPLDINQPELPVALMVDEDRTVTFRLQTSDSTSFRCRYKNPYQAMVQYAYLYNHLAFPWSKRLYHQNRLDDLRSLNHSAEGTEKAIVGEQKMGAPYVWGGKQSLETIITKLKQHPLNQDWVSVRKLFPQVAPVNLDEGESAWDYPKGSEIPSLWCGLDCSGLVEQCSRYAGLQFNWSQSEVIAHGSYQGIVSFEKIKPGDVVMVLKKGMLVHFGIVSKTGHSVKMTKIIHTVWFTNYRLHHNSVLKTIETSLAELSNQYEYQFIRLKS